MSHFFGQLLVQQGLLTREQLEAALRQRRNSESSLPRLLAELGLAEEGAVLAAWGQSLDLPLFHCNGNAISPEAIRSLPAEVVGRHKCIPVEVGCGHLTLAVPEPPGPELLEEVRFTTGLSVRAVLCPESEIVAAIQQYYDVTVEKILDNLSDEGGEDAGSEQYFIHDLREKASEPTLVNLINLIISEAIQDDASDIHVELFEREMKIKYRIDGILHELPPPPKNLQPAIVSRIKIMAGMDIAKRHVAQDGHIRITLAHSQVDIRVATVPTVFGESVVLRILNKDAMHYSLEELGLAPDSYRRFNALLTRNHGIVLVCGPTGCGKTTTLYAALSKIYTSEKKIITIEDPVEYQLNGVNQIPVRPGRGVTFASGLRAILRQDPDILMVGEIRDVETAEIAIRSALTGHLIFSTLHTNDAASAITRLLDMRLEPYLIASSLQGVLAQRLVRRLCPHCRRPVRLSPAVLAQFDKGERDMLGTTVYGPGGCEACKGRGYHGRIGIYELLVITEEMQQMVLSRSPSHMIKHAALAAMSTMREDGWNKMCQGTTSLEEVLRQTQRDQVEDAEAMVETSAD